MIHIIISAEAYRAPSGQEPPQHMLARDGWLERSVLNLLKASWGHGESYSDVILWLAATEEIA
jgi:hypothetical protein